MIEKGAVLPLFYLPPVEYFTELNIYNPDFLVERHEHFPKQTYRNRANIYSPDGLLTLVVLLGVVEFLNQPRSPGAPAAATAEV